MRKFIAASHSKTVFKNGSAGAGVKVGSFIDLLFLMISLIQA